MTGLEETFYIMAIIYMAFTFIAVIILLISVLVIRSKINKIHDNIESKINSITTLAERGGELSAIASSEVLKQAKKAFKKAKK
jgi:F0F1-type ATP synthase membrane subunit b/b'